MWFLLLLVYPAHTIFHVQGEDRLILKDGKHPCEGLIKIYHKGTWGYAGDTFWNKSTEEVVCRSTHCGKPVEGSTEDVTRPMDSKVWFNEMNCTGSENHLWDCSLPGWGISVYRRTTVKKLTCSNKIKMSLDGFRCAGAVQYSTDGEKPSGYICADNWGKKEADYLCESLNCGKSKEMVETYDLMVWKGFEDSRSKKMVIKCTGIEDEIDNLWQCVTQESSTCKKPASVICQGHERLQLTGNTENVCSGQLQKEENGKWENIINQTRTDACQQMHCGTKMNYNDTHMTCSDKVKVQLDDRASKCFGTVSIKVNNTLYHVCASSWTESESKILSKELKCGKMISEAEKKGITTKGIMDNVKCSGSESSLWHCQAKHGTSISCPTAYVVYEKSIDVRLADGPGKCAGRVEIQYEGGWKQVNKNGWTDNNSNTVCRHLKCGGYRKTEPKDEKFSQGSGDFFTKKLDCKESSTSISECIKKEESTDIRREERVAVGITCENHMVVFLHGNDSCSGMVGIEQGSKTFWLSGSKETWNQNTANIVCQQMNCGKASNFNFSPNVDMNVWNNSLNCSSKHKSLLECEGKTPSPGYNDTIATVICSGKIKVTLTNRCWGDVNVCINGTCGDLCADAWTDKQSLELCEDLGCGNVISAPSKDRGRNKVTFQSLHATKYTTKLSQCNLVKNDEKGSSCQKGSAFVVCSGSVMARINSIDKCSGNVELLYEGKWLPVCENVLNDDNIQNTICEELGCGQTGKFIPYFGPNLSTGSAISQLQCPEKVKKFKGCNITSETKSCPLAGLQCSKWAKVTLNSTCSGEVYVRTDKDSRSRVSVEGWTEKEGNQLCKDLKCGQRKSMKPINISENLSFWNTKFSCANNSEKIWDCENNAPPTQMEQLYIKCEEKPSVTLSEKCNGLVKINGIEVCDTNWNHDYSHLVCQEQECSNAIAGAATKDPNPNNKYYHVLCEDYHSELGQCKRYEGKCGGKLVAVSCVENVKFRTTEKCGGQLQVNYRDNKWENICFGQSGVVPKLMNQLCLRLGCDDFVNDKTGDTKQHSKLTTLDCTEEHMEIKHCVSNNTCGKSQPVNIYCKKYVAPPTPQPLPPPIPVVSIILGLGVVLIVVILIVIFVRIYMMKKARNAMKVPSRMLSQQEEFESGEFEDIKDNEMEDFSRGNFRSEAEFVTENDARSNSSLPYDDIDEVTEDQPLTSQTTAAGASGSKYIHEDQSPGKFWTNAVTYEVDDPQENYDDIDTSPEIAQTKAEVHDSPQPTPESCAVAPQKSVQEEDYLVPGQDG